MEKSAWSLCNVSDKPYEIEPFERICQMVIAPVVPCDVEEVTELGNTERGEGGFGSTGKNKRISTIYHCPYL